jgi:hypothetical protein
MIPIPDAEANVIEDDIDDAVENDDDNDDAVENDDDNDDAVDA